MRRDRISAKTWPAEVGRHREVAVLVEVRRVEARPPAVDLSAADAAAEQQHDVGVAMVGAAIAVLLHGAAELGHRHDRHVRHPRTEVARERRDREAEVAQPVGELTLLPRPRACPSRRRP